MQCPAAREELERCLMVGDRSPAVRAHVAGCAPCRAYAEHLEALELALRAAGGSAPTVDETAFVARVLDRTSASSKPTDGGRWGGAGARPLLRRPWLLAGAAGVLVAAGLLAYVLRPGRTVTAPPPAAPAPRILVTLADAASLPAESPPVRLSGVTGYLTDDVRLIHERELRDLPAAK